MTNKLQQFLDLATPEEVGQVAQEAGTTAAYLYHLAKQYGKGRCPSVTIALGIERATREIRGANKRRTPLVTAEDVEGLCKAEGA